jgi:hypothetical protein
LLGGELTFGKLTLIALAAVVLIVALFATTPGN